MNDFAAQLRRAAQSLLPPGAFLKRDRGEALYVTDAPRKGVHPDPASGFIIEEVDGLARLTPDAPWLHRLEALFPDPPDPLSASLRRFTGPPDPAALRLFARAMKRLDGGPPDLAYEKALRQQAAVCLRERLPGGGLYACAIANHIIKIEN